MQGEHAIIQTFLAPLSAGYPGSLGLNDDAARIAVPPGHDLVVTMDAIASGVHFFPDDPPDAIGWKALAVNVSDLVAKGAIPHAYLMSLAFPEPPGHAWMSAFAGGLRHAQLDFGLHLIGGDTDRRPGPLSITITALGLVPTGRMVERLGARAGDRIFVSGTLGDSALGLRIAASLTQAKASTLADAHAAMLLARYRYPQPRLALAPVLSAHARASMDISDGLMKDLGRMTALTGTGADIHAHLLPLSDAARHVLAAEPRDIAAIAAGGDDYEILAAIAPENAAAFSAASAAVGVPVTDIGVVNSTTRVTLLSANGVPITLAQSGYDHF